MNSTTNLVISNLDFWDLTLIQTFIVGIWESRSTLEHSNTKIRKVLSYIRYQSSSSISWGFSAFHTDASSMTEITRAAGNFDCDEVEFSCSNLRCRFMLHSAEWPLAKTVLLSSSWDSCEISGITCSVSDRLFLLLCLMREPRLVFLSLGADAFDALVSISLIENFIWKDRRNLWKVPILGLSRNCRNYPKCSIKTLQPHLVARRNDFFVIIIAVVKSKVVENVIRQIHVCNTFLRDASQFRLFKSIDGVQQDIVDVWKNLGAKN